MSSRFIARSKAPGKSEPQSLEMNPDGRWSLSHAPGDLRPIRILRRDPGGLIVVQWGEEIVHGIVQRDNGDYVVQSGSQHTILTLHPAAIDEMKQTVGAAQGTSGVLSIDSPIPGLIKSVLAKVGEKVAEGATLVVLEAMKMENEIPTPHAGTVEAVGVEAGQTVDAGALLVRIRI